ncbi:hypothetical protein, partial [Escherichia coli]|uniref:hypothetical protein n=1 Tax=Escherichia coli TaxID=562 RepID=UPI003EDFF946
FDEDAPYQAGAWADEVVQGDNVRTIGDVFRNKRAQFYYALADDAPLQQAASQLPMIYRYLDRLWRLCSDAPQ